jgi:hypothetical protein
MTATEQIKKLMERLPVELRPFAQSYADVMIAMAKDDIQTISDHILNGNSVLALDIIRAKMTNEQLRADLRRLNGLLALKAEQQAAQKEAMDNFILMLIGIGIAMAI